MYAAVRAAFFPANAAIEGVVRAPYLDVDGNVTAAMGVLEDDGSGVAPASMLALPWYHDATGARATAAEIAAGWNAVKARQDLKGIGGAQPEWLGVTDLRLSDDAIAQATATWLATREPVLRRYFPTYDAIQADAQFAILNMAYAMGAAFATKFPKFTAYINGGDYLGAASESAISTSGQTGAIAKRNALNLQLLKNAAAAVAAGSALSTLWWPQNTDPGATPTPLPAARGGGAGGSIVALLVLTGAALWFATKRA